MVQLNSKFLLIYFTFVSTPMLYLSFDYQGGKESQQEQLFQVRLDIAK